MTSEMDKLEPDQHYSPLVDANPDSSIDYDPNMDANGSFPDDGNQINLFGSSGSRKRVRDGSILILAVLIVATGILGGMRWFSHQNSGTVRDIKLETKVEAFLTVYGESLLTGNENQGTPQAETMVNSLTNDRTTAQVPLSQVKKNPFLMPWSKREPKPVAPDKEDEAARAERERREARMRLKDELDRIIDDLTLRSIMGRPGSYIAQLNNDIVKVGDTVAHGRFNVKAIDAKSVTLTVDEWEYTLSLQY